MVNFFYPYGENSSREIHLAEFDKQNNTERKIGRNIERNKEHSCGYNKDLDLIIIGAGPAGLFCAVNSFFENKRIIILEKKEFPGRKLLVSGSGRCNITHEGEMQTFLNHYGDHGRFLRPSLLGFTNRDLISFFEKRGLPMIQSEGGKIFPATLKSSDVLNVLIEECKARKINLRCSQEVKSIARLAEGFEVVSKDQIYKSRLLVVATGGCSYPATGSTGDGYGFARCLGHSIIEIGPALTPAYIKNYPFSELAGVSFPNLDISLYRNRKIMDLQGDVLFTHQGLSGPGILDLSRHIIAGDTIRLSFVPASNRRALEDWLLDRTKEDGSRGLKSILSDLPSSRPLPIRLIARILELSGIPSDLKCAHLNRDMRTLLVDNLTGFPMIVSELGGFNTAMVTRGGVDLKEVNSKTMESRLVGGLYLVGEVLNVDGDTGGYNLQAAFSTGMMAARSIVQRWRDS
jgi:predicted Rossmann fold flavoprotein